MANSKKKRGSQKWQPKMGRLRIAIADDDSRLRAYLVYLVKMLGHQAAAQVENGAKLVEQCLAIVPDLIISDMQMPEMTGLEAVERIWATRPIPAILVSGLPESELFAGRAAGRRPFYLTKPFTLDELAASIRLARSPRARRTKPNSPPGGERRTVAPGAGAEPAPRFAPRDSSTPYPAKLSAKHDCRSGDR